jgi:hypothetical protein
MGEPRGACAFARMGPLPALSSFRPAAGFFAHWQPVTDCSPLIDVAGVMESCKLWFDDHTVPYAAADLLVMTRGAWSANGKPPTS